MQVAEFPPMSDGDPLRISASAFVAFRDCPALLGARLEGKYGPDSIPAFRGALAHAVFARHLQSGEIADEDFDQVCRVSIGNSNINYKLANLGLGISGVREMISEVGAMYARFKKMPTEGFRGAEVHLEIPVGGNVTLLGRIDAVYDGEQGGVRLVDWKTGELGQVAEQLRFYTLLWALSEGSLPDAVEAYSVQSGEQFRVVPTQDEVVEMANEVAAMVSTIRRSWSDGPALERIPGMYCRYCPVVSDCAEGQSALRVAMA